MQGNEEIIWKDLNRSNKGKAIFLPSFNYQTGWPFCMASLYAKIQHQFHGQSVQDWQWWMDVHGKGWVRVTLGWGCCKVVCDIQASCLLSLSLMENILHNTACDILYYTGIQFFRYIMGEWCVNLLGKKGSWKSCLRLWKKTQ